MKKVVVIIAISLIACIATGLLVWWFVPTIFLKDTEANSISKIEVFHGSTGRRFTIENADEIQQIVENIQGIRMRKEKLSVGYDGIVFDLTFYDETGEKAETLIVNSDKTIRKAPFFYRNDNGGLCFDILSDLAIKYTE